MNISTTSSENGINRLLRFYQSLLKPYRVSPVGTENDISAHLVMQIEIRLRTHFTYSGRFRIHFIKSSVSRLSFDVNLDTF